jgi:TonB family protein
VSPELATVLALEIVLNETVEQACLATGATGAAIVLRRDGEMVCRASSGSTAPDLGSLLDTSSGLSGECVRTLRTQRCDDVLTDTRADVAASLRLGVRSVMVMPLLRGEELLGVFELFSSSPFAFGDRDEGTLEALATRALASLERAAQPPPTEAPPTAGSPEAPSQSMEKAGTNAEIQAEGEGKTAKGGFDPITLVLGVAVLVGAILLGVGLGRHLGPQKTKANVHAATTSSVVASVPSGAAQGATSSGKAQGARGSAPQVIPSKPRVSSTVPPGGLLVFEKGKEIFRMPPTLGEGGTATADDKIGVQRAAALEPGKSQPGEVVELPPAEAENSLLYRVEPKYPDEARQQQIQGAVVVEVHIKPDGTVESAHLVSGPPQLVQAAIDAVKQWRFQPRQRNEQAVRMHTWVTLNFRLPG